MSVLERSYGGNRFSRCYRIQCGRYDLLVENRDLYTRYRIQSIYTHQDILWHEVRNPEPVPIRPAHIIHARRIPWFMWIYYGIRDAIRKRRENRELEEWSEADKARSDELSKRAEKYMGPGRYGGRYR